MQKEIKIRNRRIGDDHPLFLIAETGVTCNYDMELTKQLIDVVAQAGADAIKFIFWFPDEIMSDRATTYTYETVRGTRTVNMFEMLDKLRFSLDQWRQIKTYADQKEVILFATVNSPSGIVYAETLGLEAYKLSSWDYNYLPRGKQIAQFNKPMLIDTGPVNTLEVAKVMQLMKDAGNDQSVLLHCYHTESHEQINMRAIYYMRQAFNTLVGFSSTDRRTEMDIVAVALGSVVLEKRLTMDRNLEGHHHVLSMEPKEFTDYVRFIRQVHASLGAFDLKPSEGDLTARRKFFRRLVANCDIPKGTVLRPEMLEGKRPEEGISPEHLEQFVGKIAKRDLCVNEPLRWADVE